MAAKIRLHIKSNTDDVFLYWTLSEQHRIDHCLGFAIKRWMTHEQEVTTDWLKNRVGFVNQPAFPGETKPSTDWPFQRYSWTDHDVGSGDSVAYRIYPVIRDAAGHLVPEESLASEWSGNLKIAESQTGKISYYFNRGVPASQFVARYVRTQHLTDVSFKNEIASHTSILRRFMGGYLLEELKSLLASVGGKTHLYAALFELRDDELIDLLAGLGSNAHIVLADGSPNSKEHDPNKKARRLLKKAKVKVIDRMVAWDAAKNTKAKALAHNKFAVLVVDGEPKRVWTGSTNWTPSGLCTQVNNGIQIESAALATAYKEQWDRLAQAKSKAPTTLAATNLAGKSFNIGGGTTSVSFTPMKNRTDLTFLEALVNAATEGILFLMFMPGEKPLTSIAAIAQRMQNGLYVRGVVNQYVSTTKAALSIFGPDPNQPLTWNEKAPEPEGINKDFGYWLTEFQKNQFGVFIHSKIILIDPLGPSPTVITGSHNFSGNASKSNDENFVVIQGNRELARAYATHVIGVYQHFRWRHTVATQGDPFGKLDPSPSWQDRYADKRESTERAFWARD